MKRFLTIFIFVSIVLAGRFIPIHCQSEEAQNTFYPSIDVLPPVEISQGEGLVLKKERRVELNGEGTLSEEEILAAINRSHNGLYELYPRAAHAYHLAMLADPFTAQVADTLSELIRDCSSIEEKVTRMHGWFQTRLTHTQMHDQFAQMPGFDPWGWDASMMAPSFKKLLPSEMKALGFRVGAMSGKCITLANFITSVLVRMGVPLDDVVSFILQMPGFQHGVAMVKMEGRLLYINNNSIELFMPPQGKKMTIPVMSMYNHKAYQPVGLVIENETIQPHQFDHAPALFESMARDLKVANRFSSYNDLAASSGEELIQRLFASDEHSHLFQLARYAYQSLYVKFPQYYLTASMRSSVPRDLAGTLSTPEAVFQWIRRHIRRGSIFPDGEERLMTADQVLVCQQGSLKDQAVLAFTLLKLNGFEPVVKLTKNEAYILLNKKCYNIQTGEPVEDPSEPIIMTLEMKERFPGLILSRQQVINKVMTGEMEKADSLMRKNLTLFPKAWQVHQDMATHQQMDLGNTTAALKSMVRAHQLQPVDANRLNTLAWWSLTQKQFSQAVAYASQGIRLIPNSSMLLENLILGRLFTGEYQTAVNLFRQNRHRIMGNRPLKDVILDALNELESMGVTHAQVPRFQALLTDL